MNETTANDLDNCPLVTLCVCLHSSLHACSKWYKLSLRAEVDLSCARLGINHMTVCRASHRSEKMKLLIHTAMILDPNTICFIVPTLFQTWRLLREDWQSMSPVCSLQQAGGEVSNCGDCKNHGRVCYCYCLQPYVWSLSNKRILRSPHSPSSVGSRCRHNQTCRLWSPILSKRLRIYWFGKTFHVVALDLILLSCFSDSDRGVCLYGYWGLELVNRPRYTEGKY